MNKRICLLVLALIVLGAVAVPVVAQPFVLTGDKGACFGVLPNLAPLDCDFVVDDAAWPSATAWSPDPVTGWRIIMIGGMDGAVAELRPGDRDDTLLGFMPEPFVAQVVKAASDETGLVYFVKRDDSTLWTLVPETCSDDGECNPQLVGTIHHQNGDVAPMNGNDMAFGANGVLRVLADYEASTRLYIVNRSTAEIEGVGVGLLPFGVQTWGAVTADGGGMVAFADSNHAWWMRPSDPGNPLDLGEVVLPWEDPEDAAGEVIFACGLDVEVLTDGAGLDARRAMGPPPIQGAPVVRTARIHVRHVKTETVQTSIRAWIVNENGAKRALFSESVELAYLGEFERRITLPALPAGTYTLVATVTRMNQGTVRKEARFEVR